MFIRCNFFFSPLRCKRFPRLYRRLTTVNRKGQDGRVAGQSLDRAHWKGSPVVAAIIIRIESDWRWLQYSKYTRMLAKLGRERINKEKKKERTAFTRLRRAHLNASLEPGVLPHGAIEVGAAAVALHRTPELLLL
jgi:hypothetical protein